MLLYTYKLEKYVKNKIVPQLIIHPNYSIKGSFKRRIPYVTDIDIVNTVYPEINEDNIHEKLVQLIQKNSQNRDIIMINITCGVDNRFKLTNADSIELKQIEQLLSNGDLDQFQSIVQKYQNDKTRMIFYLNELIWKYYKLRWTPQEVLDNQKILPGDLQVKFTDIVKLNSVILLQNFVKIGSYPIGVDTVIYYKQFDMEQSQDAILNYQIKYSNYSKEYYYMLFPIRNYYRRIHHKELYREIDDLIEKKFGLYKQLMVRIDSYHMIYDSNLMEINTATSIVKSIIKDINYLPNFHSNVIHKIQKVALNNSPATKMKEWSVLLDVLYDEINTAVSMEAKDSFFKYLQTMPKDLQNQYYISE